MKSYDSIIFDLDGTLWDTTHAVAKARNHVLHTMGFPGHEVTAVEVGKLAGLPVDEIYRSCYGDLGEDAVQKIRLAVGAEIRTQISLGGVRLYDGLHEGLTRLSRRYGLYIVSNCNPGYIENFFMLSRTERLFRDHECWGKTLKSKGENIASVVQRNGLKKSIYVGDTAGDETAAKHAGTAFIHAAWGFGEASPGCLRFPSFELLTDAFLN